MSKIMETLIINRIRSEIFSNLCENQHGFVKGKSTITAMEDLRTWARDAKSRHVIAAFVDISGAFDNVKWLTILEDLSALGASYESIELIRSYLANRKVKLKIEGTTLTKNVLRGCPQGSRLGPFLWNVAMDAALRIPHDDNLSVIAYADDIVFMAGAARVETANERIRIFYNKINNWADYRGLKLAIEKTQIISLKGGKKPGFKINLNGLEVISTSPITYLGVELDSRWSFFHHLVHYGKKSKGLFGKLRRMTSTNWGVRTAAAKILYLTVFVPRITYACNFWLEVTLTVTSR